MATNRLENETIVRTYENTGSEYRISLTEGGFVKVDTPRGVTKVSVQAFADLDPDTTGVLQYPNGDN